MKHITSNYLNYTLSIVLGGIWAFLPVISSNFSDLDGVIPILLTSIVCASLLICLLCRKGFKNTKLRMNIVDICFALYICYGIFRIGTSGAIFNPIIVCEWFGLVIIYAIVRSFEPQFLNILYSSLLLGGTMQAIIGVLQYVNLLEPNNLIFTTTGSFSNPGHYGGYLVLSVIVSFFIWKEKKYSVTKGNIFFPCFLFIQAFALLLSNSRAAWLAVIIPLGILLVNNCFNRSFYRHWYIKLSVFILISGIITSLYFYKKASADVRLLTWRSSLLMITDGPIFGHGIGSFAANYMPYQARYLDKHPGGNDALIADNNMIAFNEFIHVACEQGIVGLFLFISLLIYAFINKKNTIHGLVARVGLTGLFVFALFSYPASIFPIKVCFPVFIGILGKDRKPLIEFVLKKRVAILLIGIIGIGIFFNVKSYKMYHNAYNSLRNSDYIDDKLDNYFYMRHCKDFLYRLSEQYLKHDRLEASMQAKELLLNIAPTSSLLCDLGMIYLYKRKLDSARDCFLYAKKMTPNHMSPVYGLWLVNKAKGDREECTRLSTEILSMPVRVVNNVVLKARKEAREYMQKQ
ncbi:O-antigen ligase family protein [Butyricimonas sp.]|uniref:O-antigen ligase family protein n=1 Tax=Butyricimonas sp. TaxID=1969738 RepID=UPI0025C28C81|nr:O-antigen ligase family protein [Butyricimonas sp.]